MSKKAKIHKTADVSKDAKISDGAEIGPYCVVGKRVKLGKNTKLMSHVVIEETEIGRDCVVYPFTSIGLAPQDIKYTGEKTGLKIGNDNIIREYITIHRASVAGDAEFTHKCHSVFPFRGYHRHRIQHERGR